MTADADASGPSRAPQAAAVLRVPDPSVILLVGIAGCGKSTFAERHFTATEIVSSDRCRALVADDPTDQSATGDAFSLVTFILDKRLKRRRLTVVDATNLTRDQRRRYLGLAAKYDVPAVAVVFDLPFEVCVARDERRGDRRVGRDALQRQRREFERGVDQLRRASEYRSLKILSSPEEMEATAVVREDAGR
ncbi:MAG: ATP-binding protein [Actinobacteria bacterium]|nr:ATP-binding protein [Actinomycetota bacterium]